MAAKFKPLYLRVKEQLRADFRAAQSAEGLERLPTLDELELRYQASRPTISKALAALAAEGLLVKQAGRGAFMLAPSVGTAPASRLTIGFIAPISQAELPQEAFRGIDSVAQRRDCRVWMAGSGNSVVQEQVAAQEMIAAGARGLIIYPTARRGMTSAQDYLVQEDVGVPLVLIDTCIPEQGRTQVVFDNKRAGRQMTRWLLERGHRRIGLVFLPEALHHPAVEARVQGYQDAVRHYGLPVDPDLVCRIDPLGSPNALETAIRGLMAVAAPPTALIACDDIVAMDVIELLSHMGMHVPSDIEVTGFDNRLCARRYQPAFTTTNPDFAAMGEIACETLLDGISSGNLPAQTYILPVPLLTRQDQPRLLYGLVAKEPDPIFAR